MEVRRHLLLLARRCPTTLPQLDPPTPHYKSLWAMGNICVRRGQRYTLQTPHTSKFSLRPTIHFLTSYNIPPPNFPTFTPGLEPNQLECNDEMMSQTEIVLSRARVGESTRNREPTHARHSGLPKRQQATTNQKLSACKTWNRVVPELEGRSSIFTQLPEN
jgi:hypothetical protein